MTIFGAENPTSYFSAPAGSLDPKLFQGRVLRDWVRSGILHLLMDHLNKDYRHPELWAHAWLAGSGVSYQWSAARQPGDLDCLVGVNFVQFRKANPSYAGLSDAEIAAELNTGFHMDLQATTEDWNGYELTFYVNPSATDIRAIKPYAAYDLKYNEWTVTPSPTQQAEYNAEWETVAESDAQLAHQAYTRFNQAFQELKQTHNGPNVRNAEVRLNAALQQGNALYEEIHSNRSKAFSSTGEGYGDFNNYRWQAAKRLGTIEHLRAMQEYSAEVTGSMNAQTYGVELPDAATLIRRAALHGRK